MQGKVYIQNTQQAIPDVQVSVVDKESHQSITSYPPFMTDAQGNYTMEVKDEDCPNILIAFRKSGFKPIGVSPREDSNFDVYLSVKEQVTNDTPATQQTISSATSASGATGTMNTSVTEVDSDKSKKKTYLIAAAIVFALAIIGYFYYVSKKKQKGSVKNVGNGNSLQNGLPADNIISAGNNGSTVSTPLPSNVSVQ